MREYKFRGISAEELVGDNQWLTGFGADFCEMVDGSTEAYLYTTHGVYKVDPETVGQYTGLKDKNGVEIYEGDIFPVDFYRKIHEVRIVCYDSKQGKYKAVPLSLFHANAGSGGWTGFDINWSSEVIGNIYDHKHLLNLPGEVDHEPE